MLSPARVLAFTRGQQERLVKLHIRGFDQMSLVDWDGLIAATVYLAGCNFRCPNCQDSVLMRKSDVSDSIPVRVVLDYLREHTDFLDGVVITGGEPCASEGLPELMGAIGRTGLRTKLITNGSFPGVLDALINDELVDMVELGLKAPLDFASYSRAAGISDPRVLERIRDSVDLLLEGNVNFAFVLTVNPQLHRPEDLVRLAEQLGGADHLLLREYVPHTILDPGFGQWS